MGTFATRILRLLLALACMSPQRLSAGGSAGGGSVSGRVTLKKPGGGLSDPSGVVVYLEGLPIVERSDAKPAQVHQRDLQFTPPLTVVTQGAAVEFPNDDRVFHNVFSFSEAAKFDLGLYKSGSSKSVTFRRAGVVNVYCNIHPEMIAKILVLDTSYFAVVGADGSFRIEHVPPGTYPLVAWQAYGAELHTQVTVTAGGRVDVPIELAAGPRDTRHLRKDGTPYGRYK